MPDTLPCQETSDFRQVTKSRFECAAAAPLSVKYHGFLPTIVWGPRQRARPEGHADPCIPLPGSRSLELIIQRVLNLLP
jgi:hypothetical protein